jgi:hypothetical protein
MLGYIKRIFQNIGNCVFGLVFTIILTVMAFGIGISASILNLFGVGNRSIYIGEPTQAVIEA